MNEFHLGELTFQWQYFTPIAIKGKIVFTWHYVPFEVLRHPDVSNVEMDIISQILEHQYIHNLELRRRFPNIKIEDDVERYTTINAAACCEWPAHAENGEFHRESRIALHAEHLRQLGFDVSEYDSYFMFHSPRQDVIVPRIAVDTEQALTNYPYNTLETILKQLVTLNFISEEEGIRLITERTHPLSIPDVRPPVPDHDDDEPLEIGRVDKRPN